MGRLLGKRISDVIGSPVTKLVHRDRSSTAVRLDLENGNLLPPKAAPQVPMVAFEIDGSVVITDTAAGAPHDVGAVRVCEQGPCRRLSRPHQRG